MKQKPAANGLLLCEQIIIEETTRNVTPVNCFSRRTVGHFPSDPFPFVAFALLTDGLGRMSLKLSIDRLDTLEEIYQWETPFQFPSPLQTVRYWLRIRDCSFPVPGYYQVSLSADDDTLAQRRINIL
jgi:hypothetical protein